MDEIVAKETMLERLVETDQWPRVLAVSGELLAIEPDNAHYHRMHGLAALQLDRHRTAKRHLEAAIGCDPSDGSAHYLMGKMYAKENRLLQAKTSVLKALEIEPENYWFWVEYGNNCVMRGDFQTAKEAAGRARSLNPNHPAAESLQVLCENRRDDGSLADVFSEIESLRESLRHNPEDDFIYFRMGVLYLQELDDAANAEECFRKALELDPTDEDYREYLLKALRRHDPVLRVLNYPIQLVKKWYQSWEKTLNEKPGRTVLLLPIAPFLAVIMMILLTVWGVFLFIPSKIYEFMVKKEMNRKSGRITLNAKGFAGVYQLPFYLRFAAFVVLFLVFAAGVFWVLTSPILKEHLGNILGGLFLVGLIVGFIISARRPHQNE